MMDLRHDLTQTWRAISRIPANNGARAVMFISARKGEGVSSVAASFAMLAAQRSSKGVWLVDLNLTENGQYAAFNRGAFGQSFHPLGPAHTADLGNTSFFSIEPPLQGENSLQERFVVHRAADTRLLVSRFCAERLSPGQSIKIRTSAAYWNKVRSIADWIIVDAPAISDSGAGLAVCSQMDAIIPVILADKTPAVEAARLAQEVEAHGGNCAGLVMNALRKDARFFDQFTA